jgi:hypothetical protein
MIKSSGKKLRKEEKDEKNPLHCFRWTGRKTRTYLRK